MKMKITLRPDLLRVCDCAFFIRAVYIFGNQTRTLEGYIVDGPLDHWLNLSSRVNQVYSEAKK